MNDHPSAQELLLFLRGQLTPRATRVVIGHLLKGCALCSAELEPSAETLLVPGLDTGLAEIDPELDAAYDAAFERALTNAFRLAPAAAAAFTASTASTRAASAASDGDESEACGVLLERCRQLRHDDARQLLEVSARAVEAAELLRPERHGESKVAELQARAWAERANAHRVAGELGQAEKAMARAFDRAAEACARIPSTTSATPPAAATPATPPAQAPAPTPAVDHSLLLAHLYDLQASLLGDQRRLDEALRLQDRVYEIRMQHGDLHGAGRALISKGVYTFYGNDSAGALRLLAEGGQMIDAEREPQLVIFGIQNTAACLVDLGRLEEAAALVREHRARYQQTAGRVDRLRLLALSGWIDAGLGNLERAEQELVAARRGLESLGFGYRSAQVTLELSGVYLRLGRAAEARQAAEEAVRIFSSLGVGREALGALMVLRQSFELGHATAVVDRVADFMRRAAHDPAARFEPTCIA
jgi:tetratricopeptide (TPR) repeat protein